MNFEFDDEQGMVRDYARRFLTDRATIDAKIGFEHSEEGFDRAVWKEIVDLGWLVFGSAANAEEIAYLGILSEEIGRASFVSPLIGCWSSALVLARAGAPKAIVSDITQGRRLAGLLRPDAARTPLILQDGRLSGGDALVEWGASLDSLIVPLTDGQSTKLVLVTMSDEGVVRSKVGTFDNARSAVVRFDGVVVPADHIVETRSADLSDSFALADLLIAAEAVGGAYGALDLTVNYVKERKQFGHSIAAFQAVRHGLADVRGLTEGAWLAVWDGLSTAMRGDPIAGRAALAVWVAKKAFQEAALKGSQYHGGMGHVVEGHMQFFYRRAGTLHGRVQREWDLLGNIAEHYVIPNLSPRTTGVIG